MIGTKWQCLLRRSLTANIQLLNLQLTDTLSTKQRNLMLRLFICSHGAHCGFGS